MANEIEVHAKGFGLGLQGLPVVDARQEELAKWDGALANHYKQHEARIAVLEGRIDTLSKRELPAAETTFAEVQERLRTCPSRMSAVLGLLLSGLLMFLDAWMIAPSFELLAREHVEQLVIALMAFLGATGILHTACVAISKGGRARILGAVMAVFTMVGLVLMGIQRGHVVGSDAVGTAFFVFVSLCTPVFAAFLTLSATTRLQNAREWKKAENAVKRLRAEYDAAQAELKQAKVHLRRGAEEILASKSIFVNALQVGFDAGKKGAVQEPLAHVILKSVAVTLVILVPTALLSLPILPCVLGAGAAGAVTYVVFNHRRQHPDDATLARRRNVRFTPSQASLSATTRRLALESSTGGDQ